MVTLTGGRYRVLTDKQWELLQALLPKSEGRVGRNFVDNRRVVEGMKHRQRTGAPWRDLPEVFGSWQTVWKRHRRYATGGTWDRVLTALLTVAAATGDLDWVVSIASTVVRAHQHTARSRIAMVASSMIERRLRRLRRIRLAVRSDNRFR
ncbi:transposase [Nocardia rhamnosiphila]